MLWLGVELDIPAATRLVTALGDGLGVVAEHPRWTPHLTLARSSGPRGDPALAEAAAALSSFRSTGFTVDALTLFESRGGRSHVVHAAPLAGVPGTPRA